jgi:hypothetical protein
VSPRYRWIKLYTIAYIISVCVIIPIIVIMYCSDPPKYRQPIGILNILEGLAFFVALYFVFFVIVGAGFSNRQFAIKSEMDAEREEQEIADAARDRRELPGVTVIPDYKPPVDGPGRYHIQGVDRHTERDATLEIEAESAANAKVKAELKNIVVTSVTKIV